MSKLKFVLVALLVVALVVICLGFVAAACPQYQHRSVYNPASKTVIPERVLVLGECNASSSSVSPVGVVLSVSSR